MNMEIASDLGISENRVSKWRIRFSKNPTLDALKDERAFIEQSPYKDSTF